MADEVGVAVGVTMGVLVGVNEGVGVGVRVKVGGGVGEGFGVPEKPVKVMLTELDSLSAAKAFTDVYNVEVE